MQITNASREECEVFLKHHNTPGNYCLRTSSIGPTLTLDVPVYVIPNEYASFVEKTCDILVVSLVDNNTSSIRHMLISVYSDKEDWYVTGVEKVDGPLKWGEYTKKRFNAEDIPMIYLPNADFCEISKLLPNVLLKTFGLKGTSNLTPLLTNLNTVNNKFINKT